MSYCDLCYTLPGLVGFARLIPGDVYEVTTRMGLQKWKTKGRIRMNAQQWDNDMFVFKVNLQDILRIKVCGFNIP